MEKLLEILREIQPDADYETCTTLVTDNYLDPHTKCITFKDLGVGASGAVERRLSLTACSRRDIVRFCDIGREDTGRMMMETRLYE